MCIRDRFKIIRDLREKGIGIIYISHRMDEIKIITDRVTVMRDGEYVGTLISKDCTKDDIINMMVGRTIYEEPKSVSNVPDNAPVVLKVEHLQAGKMVQDISLSLIHILAKGCEAIMKSNDSENLDELFQLGGSSGGARPKVNYIIDGEEWIVKFASSLSLIHILWWENCLPGEPFTTACRKES